MKKLLTAILSFALVFSTFAFTGNAIIVSPDFAGDSELLEQTIQSEMAMQKYIFSPEEDSILQSISPNAVLPSSVDLSASPYFPNIKAQGNVNSCVAYAIAYYQFTYEVNRLNKIESKDNSDAWYSPDWAYYAGVNSNYSVNSEFVYNFLKDHGNIKWNDLTPKGVFQNTSPYPVDEAKMLEALKTRVVMPHTYTILSSSGSNPKITSNTDSDLNQVKNLLNSGYVLRVVGYFDFNSIETEDKYINYRCYKDPKNNKSHCYLVVGYDDNVWYDYDNDNIIDQGEQGAFKIANSHGTNYGKNGYSWIMYDALNRYSCNSSSDWETNLNGTRYPVFSTTSSGSNHFVVMEVANYDVYFVAKLAYTNTPKNETDIVLSATNGITDYNTTPLVNTQNSTFNIYYDYNPIFSSVNLMLMTTWELEIKNSLSFPDVDLIDDRGTVISQMTCPANSAFRQYSADVILQRGDTNYDGIVNLTDVSRINQYIAEWDNLSTLQVHLADYNMDGIINLTDSQQIMQSIAS